MVEGDLSHLVLQAKLSFYLFVFLISTLSFYEEPSFSAPLFLAHRSSRGVKVTLCGWIHQQSRGVHLGLRTEERRCTESCLLFVSSLSLSLSLVS